MRRLIYKCDHCGKELDEMHDDHDAREGYDRIFLTYEEAEKEAEKRLKADKRLKEIKDE